MKKAIVILMSLTLGVSAVSAQTASSTSALPGYAEGAEVIRLTGDRPQIDEVGGVVYAQVTTMRANRQMRMSLLVPRTEDLKPAILYLPGGGFMTTDYLKFQEMRSALAQAGFVVAAADYRVVPDVFPAPLEDGKAAVRYLRAHAADYGIDPRRIGVIGDSAGGWLAQLLATTGTEKAYDKGDFLDQPSDVQAAVSLYGISDVRNIGEGFPPELQKAHDSPAVTEALLVNGPAFDTFAGAPVNADPAKALAAGSMGHLDGPKPPMLLMHGSADRLVSPVQSRQLFEALRTRGDQVDYVLVEGAAHGDLPWYQPDLIDRVTAWFKKSLGAPIKGAAHTGPQSHL
ncbi:alpha/beta hydrolase [Rhizobium rhizosphaerae]|uniref:Alpha/beta hydrolase n=1 Tax=Xaviernesmea rhizosphaerae TaxID=1672749 RepID=A0A1Q9AHH6_9HYPH|nr:alpha/beta hydrolase [Xaviernesmea rhizosphaerae]OLP54693.1 alpha/beta hydrolase [Xaviernesmea rhizosphaerae]